MVVVAIDGPGGVGKSTVARGVAAELDLAYLDTGATYRAATLAVLRAGVIPADHSGATAAVATASIEYERGSIRLDGEDVSTEIRLDTVTGAVSEVSAHPAVRELVVAVQRRWVEDHGGGVVEGRDIGTTVFPDAALKIFLTARPEVRAARRAADTETGPKDVDRVAAELAARDAADSTRSASPLLEAADAIVVDTSDLGVRGVIDAVVALAGRAGIGRTRSEL